LSTFDQHQILACLRTHPRLGWLVIKTNGIVVEKHNVPLPLDNFIQVGYLIEEAILLEGSWHEIQGWQYNRCICNDHVFLVSKSSLSVEFEIWIIQEQIPITQITANRSEAQQFPREVGVILDSCFDEIYVTDGNGVTVFVNAACERFYNIKSENLVGKSVQELEQRGIFYPSVTSLVLNKKKRITIIQNTLSGRRIIATGNPVFDDRGNISKVITTSKDITELLMLRQKLTETEQLAVSVQEEAARLKRSCMDHQGLIAVSPAMKEVLAVARQVSALDSTVLLLGESGVGKDVVARFIHQLSTRYKGPFVTINCAAIPDQLLESELFGYEKGAFTGASRGGKRGLIELGNGGTVFFDEIGELSLGLQAKLLRVIQERKLTRVGGTKAIELDIRIISATNKDLQEQTQNGRFREDLYYRLNVIPITIPPLRERVEDIAPLIMHFLNQFNSKYNTEKIVAEEAMEHLLQYDWPGNVREVANMVERIAALTPGNQIEVGNLPAKIMEQSSNKMATVTVRGLIPLKEAVEAVESQLFTAAYRELKNTYKVAEILGVNQSTVVRKLQKYCAK